MRQSDMEYWSNGKRQMTGSAERRPTKRSMRKQNGRARLRRADLAKLPKRCNWATAFGMRQPAAALLAAVHMGCRLEVIEGRPALSLLHYSTSAGGQRAAKKWQPSDSALKFNVLSS